MSSSTKSSRASSLLQRGVAGNGVCDRLLYFVFCSSLDLMANHLIKPNTKTREPVNLTCRSELARELLSGSTKSSRASSLLQRGVAGNGVCDRLLYFAFCSSLDLMANHLIKPNTKPANP